MGELTFQAIQSLRPTARSFGDVIANSAVNQAKSRRDDARLEFDIGRQRQADEMNQELFRRGTEEYERKNAWRKQPLNLASFIKKPYQLNHFAAETSRVDPDTGDKELFGEGIARMVGGKLDQDSNIVLPDGRIATGEDLERNKAKVFAYMYKNTNQEKLAWDQLAEAQFKMQSAKTPEEAQAYQAEIAKIQAYLNPKDPRRHIAQLEDKISKMEALSKFMGPGEGFGIDITRLEKKRDRLVDQMEKEKDRALSRELADKRIRAERAKGRGDKDLRGPFGKLVDDYLRIGKFIDPKYTLEQAKKEAESHQNDPRVSSALMQMLTAIDNSYDMTPEAQKELKKNIYSGLKEIANRHAGPKEEEPKDKGPALPKGFVWEN